jgi:uncharacterized membrane protein
MEHQSIITGIELIAGALEIVGVAVIALAFAHAMIRGLVHFAQRKEDAFSRLKIYIGKALQLALELLVAADVIRTVTIAPTREGLLSLGLLILVRTILSWSITVEIEGCWPWQVAAVHKSEVRGQKSEER